MISWLLNLLLQLQTYGLLPLASLSTAFLKLKVLLVILCMLLRLQMLLLLGWLSLKQSKCCKMTLTVVGMMWFRFLCILSCGLFVVMEKWISHLNVWVWGNIVKCYLTKNYLGRKCYLLAIDNSFTGQNVICRIILLLVLDSTAYTQISFWMLDNYHSWLLNIKSV